jgi:hypothetical protein
MHVPLDPELLASVPPLDDDVLPLIPPALVELLRPVSPV